MSDDPFTHADLPQRIARLVQTYLHDARVNGATGLGSGIWLEREIARLVDQAILDEREACAAVVQDIAPHGPDLVLAGAIRRRTL